jgi:hypothetical protein
MEITEQARGVSVYPHSLSSRFCIPAPTNSVGYVLSGGLLDRIVLLQQDGFGVEL